MFHELLVDGKLSDPGTMWFRYVGCFRNHDNSVSTRPLPPPFLPVKQHSPAGPAVAIGTMLVSLAGFNSKFRAVRGDISCLTVSH